MKKSNLVFIPVPASGHLTPFIEFAKHLLDRNERLSIRVLIIPPLDNETNLDSYINSLSVSDSRIKYNKIPPTNNLPRPSSSSPMAFEKLATLFIESHKPQVEQAVMELVSDDSTNLLGFVLDMFCCCMIDIANKFNIPSYIFFTTNTTFLGFLLHLPVRDNNGELNFLIHRILILISRATMALECSDDYRFLWSIRKPPLEDMIGTPTEYTSYENVLPDGFLARVKDRGMVCGWAPQVEVLAHEAIRGFVSHCGWNSILESLWYGVPIATWPLNAEQQMNAFFMVKELGLSVELSLTYRSNGSELVMKDQIKRAIDCLMDDMNSVRERVKRISEESRKALMKGGSSFVTLGKLVEDMFENIGEML